MALEELLFQNPEFEVAVFPDLGDVVFDVIRREQEPEVREHDPRIALDGGSDGLDFYRDLASEAAPFLAENGRMMVEFGDEQEKNVWKILQDQGWEIDGVEKDYSNRPRILIADRPV